MLRLSFSGSSYVGVFARATDSVVLVRTTMDESVRETVGEELDATVVPTTVGGAGAVGSLAVGNSAGLVVSGRATDHELERLADATAARVTRLPG